MGLYDCSIYGLIRRNGRTYHGENALTIGGQRLTHRGLLESVDRLSAGLMTLGVKKGDRVCILGKNSLEYVYLYGAAARLGAVLVPVNWRLKPEEIAYVISDTTPAILFADPEFQSMAGELLAAAGSPAIPFSMGPGAGPFKPFADLMKQEWSGAAPDVSSDDDYVIIHTAAVHGKPRGAVLSQRNLLITGLQLAWRWGLNEQDVNLVALPLFHVAGSLLMVAAMTAGASNVLLPSFDVQAALDHVVQDKVTMFGEFPPMLKSLMDKAAEKGETMSTFRHVLGLDQPDTVNAFQEMTGGTFWAIYGQTETGGLVTTAPYTERLGSAGKAFPLAEVAIEDDQGNILPPGKSGEIVVQGPMVFRGYWNLPADTQHTFRHSRHHTGDRGRFDEDGYLWFEGRAPEKELIKPGGENVYPAEVESAILEHTAVKEACVIGVPDSHWGEAIKAVCSLKPGAALEGAELIEFVASRIARFKKPKHVVFVPELPKKPDGTVDREKVKADHGKV
ncbi:MAG: AMP-binding protein [Deltaproteobacteria bacterium]|nr:AMP-binding protein [Deltaproteobacteria bacterium]